MHTTSLADLVAELFTTIKLLSGYPVPERLPEIHIVSPAEIQRLVCKRDCGVKAVYLPDRGVFVSDAIGSLDDAFGRSVLLHELVHHVQHLSGRFDVVPDACDRWFSKEREAYQVQNAYLQREGERRRFALDSLPFMCGDRGR